MAFLWFVKIFLGDLVIKTGMRHLDHNNSIGRLFPCIIQIDAGDFVHIVCSMGKKIGF